MDFCTYLDSRYLARALVLYQSLRQHSSGFRLHVLCLDDRAHKMLERLALPGVSPIRMADFECDDDELRSAKGSRSKVEYYFTCTPSLPVYVFRTRPDVDLVFYVDADFRFFSSPDAILKDMGAGSIYVVDHRHSNKLHNWEPYGRFNVGILGFRRDAEGMRCLARWRAQCIAWCHDRVECGRFADQKYLDDWPSEFRGVVVGRHPGVNVAPWNKANYRLESLNGIPHVDRQPVVCYHFHGLRLYSGNLVELQAEDYGAPLTHCWRRLVYDPYIRELVSISETLDVESKGDLRYGRSGLSLLKRPPGAQVFWWRKGRLIEVPAVFLRLAHFARTVGASGVGLCCRLVGLWNRG